MLKLIVTGTGRSGTVYMARVLTDLGIPCGHESIFNNQDEKTVLRRFQGALPPTISECSNNPVGTNIRGWLDLGQLVADSSYMAMPYLDCEGVKEVPILHVVRNPLAVISSFVLDLNYFKNQTKNIYNKEHWEEWIYKQIPELNTCPTPIERACLYYIKWNKTIESKGDTRPYLRHKVDGPFTDEFFKFIGLPKQEVGFKNKKINSKKKRQKDFLPEDIPSGPIKDEFLKLMEHYGYLTRHL